MTCRELPSHEWDRLDATPFAAIRAKADPAFARVFVVEDEDGKILGIQPLFSFVSAEGFWVHEDARYTDAARLLLRKLVDETQGLAGLTTQTTSDQVARMILRHAGIEVTARTFYWPLSGVRSLLRQD